MKHRIIILICLVLSGCATFAGNRTVNVTEAEIQQKLNEKLAIPISLLKVFDVNLSNAIVTFDQSTGRMHTTMNSRLSSTLFNENMAGKLGVSGHLRFDPATSAIMLDDPIVEQFSFDGASEQYNDLLNAFAKAVGGEMLNGLVLYQVRPEDLSFGNTQYAPKEMVVTDKGLQILLSPQ